MDTTSLSSPELKFIVPTGAEVVIREHNGEDESLLTTIKYIEDGSNINRYVAAITMSIDGVPVNYDLDAIMKLLTFDKYAILIQSRIFSVGPNFEFEWEWEPGRKEAYTEDLTQYLWDYSPKGRSTFPSLVTMPGYFQHRIEPAPLGNSTSYEFELSSKKRVRFNLLDSYGENFLLQQEKAGTLNIATQLMARGLCLAHGAEWIPVESFKLFSSADTRELRTIVKKVDPYFRGLTTIQDPKTRNTTEVPLLAFPTFLLGQ